MSRPYAVLLTLTLLSGCGAERIEGLEPGDCSDRADNDSDGAFDCDDSGCKGSPDCSAPPADGPVDDVTADTAPPADTGEPPEQIDDPRCLENGITVTTASGDTPVLDGFVWTTSTDGLVIIGLATDGVDPCVAAADLGAHPGWAGRLHLHGAPEAGESIPIVPGTATDTAPADTTWAVVDLVQPPYVTQAESGHLTFTVDVIGDVGEAIEVSDFGPDFLDGASITRGGFVACYCEAAGS